MNATGNTASNKDNLPCAEHRAVGATVTRIYYALPTHYGVGETFSDFTAAVAAARERVARIKAGEMGELAKPLVYVDTRMVLTWLDGGSEDFVYDRSTVAEP